MRTLAHSADLAPQRLDHATALPARYYVEPSMAALDRALIFDRGWQLLAHVCQLRSAGDHVIADLGGLPVIAVRGHDEVIRALHNVCRHRAGPIATCDGVAAKSLRCRYHGWTYGLDGVLRSAPEMSTAAAFDPRQIRLPAMAVRCGTDWCSPLPTTQRRRHSRPLSPALMRASARVIRLNATAITPRQLRYRLQLEGLRR